MNNVKFPVRRVACRPRKCSVMWCSNLATDIYTKGVREAFSGNPVRLCKMCAAEIGKLAGMINPADVPAPEAEKPAEEGVEQVENTEESAETDAEPVESAPEAEKPVKRGRRAAK